MVIGILVSNLKTPQVFTIDTLQQHCQKSLDSMFLFKNTLCGRSDTEDIKYEDTEYLKTDNHDTEKGAVPGANNL